MKTNKISCFEIGIIIYFMIRSTSLGMAMTSYIHIGGVDGYLSPLIGMFFGFIPLYFFIKLFNYKPELNLFEKVDYIFSKYGKLVNIIICFCTIFFVSIIFWNLINFISSQYLFRTPNLYVSMLFGICFIYTCTKKFNVISRASSILFYVSITLFIFFVFGLLGNPKLNNLLPFLENGLNAPMISGLAHVSYSILPLFILLIIPKNSINNNKNLTKYIIIFYLIANIGKIIATFFTLSTFGIDLAKLYEFPDFVLLRRISTTGFFQRFESILATQWIFDFYIMITICFYFIKLGYKHLINKGNENIFISIFILIFCYICSNHLFKNNTTGDIFILYYLPFILCLVLFILPLIVYFKSKKTT